LAPGSTRKITCVSRGTIGAPQDVKDPDRIQSRRGRNTSSISAMRSATGRFSVKGGSVGFQ
jgi:hypothetical protein